MALVLIVDDDRSIRRVLNGMIEDAGFEALTAESAEEALSIVENRELDLILTDMKMPGKSGIELLEEIRSKKPALPVIMVTAFGEVETAVSAMKKGAYDFILKPFDEEELLNVVKKALSESLINKELISAYFDERFFLPDVVGDSPAMRKVIETVLKVAPSDATVLVTGETGVGKELIARAIHAQSARKNGPFLKVNCAAIPESLLESELFGYEKGAFSGAVISKPGRFELAHRGTLFLDEIGDMPPPLQAKLLGVLQDRKFERLGGVKTIDVDVRIVAATNMDLDLAVKFGKFRADLFYRLNVVPVRIPPLRERRGDIPRLASYFLRKFAKRHGKNIDGISAEALSVLSSYDWPGNIRELENTIERMVLMSDASETGLLGLEFLPQEIRGVIMGTAGTFKEKIETASEETEKRLIAEALGKTEGNRTKAAEILGISRRTIQKKIREYGL